VQKRLNQSIYRLGCGLEWKEAQFQCIRQGGANMRTSEGTLAQPGEYDSTIRLRRRCGLMSNYFDRSLLLLLLLPNIGSVLIDADVFLSC